MGYLRTLENRIFVSYTVGFYLGWIAYLSRAELLLRGFHNQLQVLALLSLMLCSFILWVNCKDKIPSLPMTRFKLVGMLLLIPLMLVANYEILFTYTSQFLGPVVKDLVPISFILSAPAIGFFSLRQRKIFGGIFLFFLAIAVFTIFKIDTKYVVMAENRLQAFQDVGTVLLYSYQMAIGVTAAYILMLFLTTARSVWLSLSCSAGMLFWAYASLIYSKRQGLGEFAIVVAAILFLLLFGKNLHRIRKYMLSGMVVLGVVGLAYVTKSGAAVAMFSRLVERFRTLGDTGLAGFDRFSEASGYLANADALSWVIGEGIGGFSFNVISMHVIHIGWANLIFKGGLLLALFVFVSLSGNVIYVLMKRGFPHRLAALFFPLFIGLQLMYAPVWSNVPSSFVLGIALFAPEIFLLSERYCQGEGAPRRPPGMPPAMLPPHRR
ncbi:MAG: hypothetical protein ACSHX8_06295 [Opitutaceae bacterium]